MSEKTGKSKHPKPSVASVSKDSKKKPETDGTKPRKEKTKHLTTTSSKQARNRDLSASSDSDDEFAVHVTSTPKNTAILEAAATIEQKRNEGLFDDPNDLSLNSSSSDVEEDDDAEMAGGIADEFLSVLSKLAQKHPDIYEKDKRFFPDEIEVAEPDRTAAQRVTYKDMVRQDILDRVAKGDDAGSDLDEEEELKTRSKKTKTLTYAQEQELAKKEMLAAAWASDDDSEEKLESSSKLPQSDGSGLSKRTHSKEQETAFENEYQAFLARQAEEEEQLARGKSKTNKSQSILSHWTRKGLDKDESFLRDYVLNKRWLGTGDSSKTATEAEAEPTIAAVDDAEDTKELEKQDDFESAYNFRYEDPHGHHLVTHSRDQESVRVETNKRAEKRTRAREKKRLEKQAAEEEKIEAKKKRKADILARVSELAEASGLSDGVKKLVKDEEDWDPDAHDQTMADTFGEDYYAQGEKERPSVGDADIHDVEQWLEKAKKNNNGDSAAAEDIEKALEQYYNLDFEDDIGGEKTRFRYTQVAPQSFGLTNEELLNMSDSELDQLIPMKKLATYREDEGHVKRQHMKYKRLLLQQQRKGLNPSSSDHKSKKSHKSSSTAESSRPKHDKKRKRDDVESSETAEVRPPHKKRKDKKAAQDGSA